MISSTLRVIVCVFVVCLIVHGQNPEKKTQTGSISGKVTHKGNGMAGVPVAARVTRTNRQTNPPLVVTTDPLGNYRIANVAPGDYEVAPLAPLYVLASVAPVRKLIVGEGENIENVNFTLVRGGVVTGKIVDADGRPVIQEQVELSGAEGPNVQPMARLNEAWNATDDRGVYRIYGVPPGKYRVSAGVPEERMYFGVGRGTVYRQTFYPSTTESSQATVIEITEGGEATNVDITLHRSQQTFTVTGHVVDGDTGKPVPNVGVGLQKFKKNGSIAMTGFRSNQLGEIKFENVTPGKYAVFVEQGGASRGLPRATDVYAEPIHFEVTDQDVTDLLIKTSSESSVSGLIVFDGAQEKATRSALNEVMVWVQMDQTSSSVSMGSPSTLVNPDGSFTIGGLRPGVIRLAVVGRSTGTTREFEVSRIERDGVVLSRVEVKEREQIKGLRLVVKLRTGRIRGVTKFENGEMPFGRVQILVKREGDEYGQSVELDDRGRFMTNGLAAGVYEVSAQAFPARGQPSSAKQQVVVVDNQVTDVTLTLILKTDPGRVRP